MTVWVLGTGNGYCKPISTPECGKWIGPMREQSDDLMSCWVSYSMHRYPYYCIGPATLTVHNLPGNWGKAQQSEFDCLGYLRAVDSERTVGRELFSSGVWIWRYYSPYKNLTQSCDCRKGKLNTGLSTLAPCKNELLRYRGLLLTATSNSNI